MCTNPSELEGLIWFFCYLTSDKHQLFYLSFGTVFALLLITAPVVLVLGFLGALASRSALLPLRLFGATYTNMVRGIPDIAFFMFIPLVLDQGIELLRYYWLCPDTSASVYQGNDFVVCRAAKMPLHSAAPWQHELYGFSLAVIAFAVVFGAFAANTLKGAMNSVPRAQLETASAYGMSRRQCLWRVLVPQMWIYALPGLNNLWLLLIKATPLLFLLGVEDIVYWARELGGSKSRVYSYPHPDWRIWYFGFLMLFYLALTSASQRVFDKLTIRYTRGIRAHAAM